MRILLVHNRYQLSGGEDAVVEAEKCMLQNHGHEVLLLEADNSEISGALKKISSGFSAVYSGTGKSRVAAELTKFNPQIMHVHNFFPLFSPSIYYAARQAGVPVVQTLHNYRLLCPNALFLRDGHICEACLGKAGLLPSIFYGCYRGSRAATASVASMLGLHHALGTWRTMVDAYIALTEFSRERFIRGGLPSDRLFVKPNFVESNLSIGQGDGRFALFLGRLSEEKGISTLLTAWSKLRGKMRLIVAGDGPLRPEAEKSAQFVKEVELLGSVTKKRAIQLLRHASVLIVPSIWYEGFPMVVAEAFAAGVPIIASDIGALGQLIHHGRTGLHFRPGDAEDLASQVEWLIAHEEDRQRMRQAARTEFELHYTSDRNYDVLLAIYHRAQQYSRTKFATGTIHSGLLAPE